MVAIPTSQKRPFIPAPGCVQLEAVYHQNGHVAENVYHVLQGDGATEATPAELDALMTALFQWEAQSIQGNRVNGVTMVSARARQMGVQNGVVREATAPANLNGLVGGAALPSNATLAVKWTTGFGGRSFRGRTYHIGLPASAVTGDTVSASHVASLVQSYEALLTKLNGVPGATMVVISFAHNKFWRATAVATPILGISIDPIVDSQRRRLLGRGQ